MQGENLDEEVQEFLFQVEDSVNIKVLRED